MSDPRPSIADLAPYPEREEDVTADGMARYWAAFCQLHHRMAMDHPDRDKAMKSLGMVVAYYGVTYLLRELEERAGTRQADEVAKILWSEWAAGSGIGSDVWLWLTDEYDIDPHRINRIAAQIIADETKADLPSGGKS